MQDSGQQTHSNYGLYSQCVVSSIQAHSYVVTVQTMSVVQITVHCTHAAQSSTGRKKGETWAA